MSQMEVSVVTREPSSSQVSEPMDTTGKRCYWLQWESFIHLHLTFTYRQLFKCYLNYSFFIKHYKGFSKARCLWLILRILTPIKLKWTNILKAHIQLLFKLKYLARHRPTRQGRRWAISLIMWKPRPEKPWSLSKQFNRRIECRSTRLDISWKNSRIIFFRMSIQSQLLAQKRQLLLFLLRKKL